MKLPNKIYIIGGSGSGKSTLARKISKIKHIPVFNTDDIMRCKKYTEKLPIEQRTQKLDTTILKKYDNRIIEGFSIDRADACYKQADLVVVLDVPKYVVAWRIFKRYIFRVLHGDYTETFRGMIGLIQRAMNYQNPKHKHSLRRHLEDCEKYKCNYIIICDTKEIVQ